MADEIRKRVEDILGNFSSLNNSRELFSELNYEIARDTLPRRDWGKAAKEALTEDP